MAENDDRDLSAHLGEVARLVQGRVDPADAALVSALATRYYSQVPAAEDLLARSAEELAAALVAHFELARRRTPGTPNVRVYSPPAEVDPGRARSVVDVVTDDMPFLVDSLRMDLNRRGVLVDLIVHPQVEVERDPTGRLTSVHPNLGRHAAVTESFVHIEIERQIGTAATGALHDDLLRVLGDVRAAVEDWTTMRERALDAVDRLRDDPPSLAKGEVKEAAAFLRWLAGDHFTFLGYREYDLVVENGEDALRIVPGRGLGILRELGEGDIGAHSSAFLRLPPEARRHARDPEVLVLTKANSRSTVHRPAYLDYVGVRRFDAAANVVGELRFLGLYSSSAYSQSMRTIPVVRRKCATVMRRAGFPPDSHSGKDLSEILETYPRDEMFQATVEELQETAMGILALQERQRVRLFVRRDRFGRFFSCLVFVPRDRYTTTVRRRMEQILMDALGGTSVEYTTRVSESMLARLHFVVRTDPAVRTSLDLQEVEERLEVASRSWNDALVGALVASLGEGAGGTLAAAYREAFPVAFEEDVSADAAVADVVALEALQPDDISLTLSTRPGAAPGELRLQLYRSGGPIALSDVLPILEHLGVSVIDERPYAITRVGGPIRWIYAFGLRAPAECDISSPAARARFCHAFGQVWRETAESDGFNRLVLLAGLPAEDVAILRALCRYLRQTATRFSQEYMEQTFAANPQVASLLVTLFRARLDPQTHDPAAATRLTSEVETAIDGVATLDEDRILRMFLRLVQAILRTNAYLPGDRCLSFKLDAAAIPDLPLPRPRFEIFVYSPRVEGVHLRAGFVARGGIRWSDRREDFRTEILGLMKAQTVKNVVIVPVGAKGGFVVKRPPSEREALAAEVQACYRTFIGGLLDVTDNLVDGEAVHPPGLVVHDEDADAYLVVAADKGTATFSDVANEISLARGYWLGDAFASGGSAGYDHKKMGITARGAWESARRHFREVGIDPDTDDVTVVGIGDMSGDVFGNGMLLSCHLRLVAAFDHRHVFVDPTPDPAAGYEERRRLFDLPRSSWADYDPAKLSPGGGVWPRTAKSIALPPEARAALGTAASTMTPAQLIRTILRAPVDLLWNGGIGTYVKSHDETHAEVGDKANDGVRVDGRELRCRVVVEGGNLGLTERGRVEYAIGGGRINTDAIDNSAGVDCSDHEVNLKILLDGVVADGELSVAERNQILAGMTDEVAAHVLRHNYEQNQALGNARALAVEMFDVHVRFLHALERAGRLDRAVELLPDDDELAERANHGIAFTSPELAVLLAYAKISVEAEIRTSRLLGDPRLAARLHAYFPAAVRDRYARAIGRHPLRREILSTVLTNDLVNRAGISFVFRMTEETGASVTEVVAAHFVARGVFALPDFWSRVEALDRQIAADVQVRMLIDARRLAERASHWLLRHRSAPIDVDATVAELGAGVAEVTELLPELLGRGEGDPFEREIVELAQDGVPRQVAATAAYLEAAYAALDVVEAARRTSRSIADAAAVYFALGERLHLDRLRDLISALPRNDRWQTGARAALRDELYDQHRLLAVDVLEASPDGAPPADRLALWAGVDPAALDRYVDVLEEIEAGGVFDLTTLSVAVRELRELRTRENPAAVRDPL